MSVQRRWSLRHFRTIPAWTEPSSIGPGISSRQAAGAGLISSEPEERHAVGDQPNGSGKHDRQGDNQRSARMSDNF
jgi:hypothetical protein